MGFIELIASLCILASAVLAWMQRPSNFALSGIGSLLYVLIFFILGQPANMFINLLFVGMSVAGLIQWGYGSGLTARITRANSYDTAEGPILIGVFSFILLGIFYASGLTNLMDYLTSALYATATGLLIYRKLECWIVFIITDLIYLPYLWSLELYWTFGLFLILTFNAIYGYFKWKNLIAGA